MRAQSLSCVQLFATPWTAASQAPLSVGFSRQEYWSGLPCPPPGDLPDPGIKPESLMFPALAGTFFTTRATWEVQNDPFTTFEGFYYWSLGEGNGTPLQYSCLENPMDRGAWEAAVHGVAKSRTRLSDELNRTELTFASVCSYVGPGYCPS